MRAYFLACFLLLSCFGHTGENFFLVNGQTGQVLASHGKAVHKQVTPCCTFNIALSLIGFEEEVLKSEELPLWPYQESYSAEYAMWRAPHSPTSWMKHSCTWYSKKLACELGIDRLKDYLSKFRYGNQDLSQGPTKFWLSGSLKISPVEQVSFLQDFLNHSLPLSSYSKVKTREILLREKWEDGSILYGKTGFGIPKGKPLGWFVGWLEQGEQLFIFAYNNDDEDMRPEKSVPRTRELLQLAIQ